MSEVRDLINQLIAAGVDPAEAAEVVARAVIAGAANSPKHRSAGAIRQERYRRNKASQVTESDVGDALSSPSGSSPKPLSPNPHQSIPPSPPKGGSSPAGFEDFWAIYPNRVGKRDAEKSFAKALSRANLPEILAGLRRYVAKTDDRPWCNPATWLNQDRWADDPAHVPRQQAPPRERTIFDAIDDFTGRNANELSAGTTIDHDGGDYSPNVHLLASPTRR